MAPAVMFGIGATKAGTSWLYEYLADHPECYFRSVKELHFFDALDQIKTDRVRAECEATLVRLRQRIAEAPPARALEIGRRIADYTAYLDVLRSGDERAYLNYLTEDAGPARLVGDVTPAYGLLGAARLTRMAAMAADVRFVYLLRDPLARLWSHVRMMARRRSPDGRVEPDRARFILKGVLTGAETELADRSDYRSTLTRLYAAVPSRQRLVMFSEDLFTPGGIDRLCHFLGLTVRAGATGTPVHAGEALDMTVDQRARALAWLKPQYDHVRSVMGALPAAWDHAEVRA